MIQRGRFSVVFALAGSLGCSGAVSEPDRPAGGGAGGKADDGASPYVCEAPANPDRGFPVEMAVTVSMGAQGSMRLKVGPQSLDLGTVESHEMAADSPGFQLTLGLFAEPDVSGLTNPDEVDKIVLYKVDGAEEYTVYRFFAGGQQIGGTFFADGMGTRCLDASSEVAVITTYVEEQFATGDGGFDAFAKVVMREDVPIAARPAFDSAWLRMQAKVPADEATPIGYTFVVPDAGTFYAVVVWDPNTFGAHLEICDAGGMIATGEMADDGTFEWR